MQTSHYHAPVDRALEVERTCQHHPLSSRRYLAHALSFFAFCTDGGSQFPLTESYQVLKELRAERSSAMPGTWKLGWSSSRQSNSTRIRRKQENGKGQVLSACRILLLYGFSWYKEQEFLLNEDGGNAFQLGTGSKLTQINQSLGRSSKAVLS